MGSDFSLQYADKTAPTDGAGASAILMDANAQRTGLTLMVATATVRYTTDGSTPSATHGIWIAAGNGVDLLDPGKGVVRIWSATGTGVVSAEERYGAFG